MHYRIIPMRKCLFFQISGRKTNESFGPFPKSSKLSPYFRYGCISVRMVYHEFNRMFDKVWNIQTNIQWCRKDTDPIWSCQFNSPISAHVNKPDYLRSFVEYSNEYSRWNGASMANLNSHRRLQIFLSNPLFGTVAAWHICISLLWITPDHFTLADASWCNLWIEDVRKICQGKG